MLSKLFTSLCNCFQTPLCNCFQTPPAIKSERKKIDEWFLQYHTVCADHGFDSKQAAEFLRSHDTPEFLHLARGLNRLIMTEFQKKEFEQGDSFDL